MIRHTRRSNPTRTCSTARRRRFSALPAIGIVLALPHPASGQTCAEPGQPETPSCLRLQFTESQRHTLGELDLTVIGQAPAGGARRQTPLLASHLHLSGLDGRLRYELRYAFDTGDILRPHRDQQTPLHTLAAERREQRWGLRLATLAGHPAVLEHRVSTQQRWTVDGLRQQGEESTQLSWQSPRADIRLHVRSPMAEQIDGTTGLRCDTSASMTLKPGAASSAGGAVRLLAKGCELPSSLTGGAASSGAASSLELSYRREGALGSDAISLEQLATRASSTSQTARTYQFQWQHQRTRGAWRTAAQASLRHHDTPVAALPMASIAPVDSAFQWAADASIARELSGGTAFARWSSARMASPLYSAETFGRTDRLHLGLDLSRWLVERMPRAAPSLIMQWQGSVSSAPDQARARDQRMDVKVAMRW